MTVRSLSWRFFLALSLAACDGPPAGAPDAGPPPGQLRLPGLDAPVEVIVDDRGMPHIYGTTLHDVIMAQGYLMARDRFPQMEFIRRSVLGRLAEVAGASLLEDDIDARHAGYARMGRAIYESLSAGDPTRQMAEAFVAGVNVYIDQILAMEVDPVVEGAEAFNLVLASPHFGHWDPRDIFAMARFQAANLSYDPRDDLSRSLRLAGVLAAFPADSSDPRLAARAGFFADYFADLPARAVFTREGFNDDGSPALLPGELGPRPRLPRPPTYLPSRRSMQGALRFVDRQEERRARIFGDDASRGSNNWVVHGMHTASGRPILANDPHLALISPPVWWYVHLDTARQGGEHALSVEGVAFAGLPGVVLGFNRHIAWGATTTGYDVTDDYEEILTGTCDADGNVTGGTVLFRGSQVPVEFFEEEIRVMGDSTPMIVRIPHVPHHGPFLPGSCAPIEGMPGRFTAISVRYTGFEISNELAYFEGLARARSVEEAREAQNHFRVGSQNFVVIDADHIFWSTESRIPVRDPRARTLSYDERGVPSGMCPSFVVPGTGEYEWIGDLPETAIPHDLDPARGWIATANQDNVGVTADGNPCNDDHYLGAGFNYGWRQFRIVERLEEFVARGDVTVEDMIALQAETQFQPGRRMRDAIVAALEDPASAIPTLTSEEIASLADVRARLMAWSFESPHGVGATDPSVVADSVAMTIFTVAMTRIIPLAIGDETDRVGQRGGSGEMVRTLERMLTDAASMHSYDATIGDTVLWDDLDTAEVETRAQIMIRGVLAALAFLREQLGPDVDEWRWGRLHTVRFTTVVPALGTDILSIPPENDPMFPDGFPRHGGFETVDPGNHGVWDATRFDHGSGASQRLVVEMGPEGPRAFNALPGGQHIDPHSPHHDDEARLWIANEQPPLFFDEADVLAHERSRLTLVP